MFSLSPQEGARIIDGAERNPSFRGTTVEVENVLRS
jgi:hypothetical protein